MQEMAKGGRGREAECFCYWFVIIQKAIIYSHKHCSEIQLIKLSFGKTRKWNSENVYASADH